MKRYAIYARCSSDEQRDKEYSTIDVQLEKLSSYVKSQQGIVVEHFSDQGISGTTTKRPGLKKLLESARSGQFEYVVCTYRSRLARGKKFFVLEDTLGLSNVSIVTTEETFSDDVSGDCMQYVTAMTDHMYVRAIRAHTKTKMEQMVAHGFVCGQIPFGFAKEFVPGFGVGGKAAPQRPIPHPDDSKVIVELFDRYSKGQTIGAVREYLALITNRNWTMSQVKMLLTNRAYIGELHFGGWSNLTAHEAIVDKETWDKVQARLDENKKVKVASSPVARPSSACDPSYLLHGLMSCPYCENNGNCGCGYTQGTAGKSGTRYYLCQYHNKYRTPCPVGRLNADVMEYSVLTAIHRASQHKTVMHKMIADSNTWAKAPDSLHDEITAIQKRLKEVNASIDNIVKFIETGGFSETLASRLNTLEATKASYTQKASEVRLAIANASKKRPTAEMVQQCWGRATEAWPRLNDKQRSTILSAVIKHVSVTSKSSVVATLATSPHFTDRMLAPNSIMGAGEGLEPPTFGL